MDLVVYPANILFFHICALVLLARTLVRSEPQCSERRISLEERRSASEERREKREGLREERDREMKLRLERGRFKRGEGFERGEVGLREESFLEISFERGERKELCVLSQNEKWSSRLK
eukprot:TRINITY_DN10455_c0_g1_i1.p2 TRINITY_DN10455_c0_g1~~TRINITY_DN10455_c0_g1_i1.p2  ORF type:complete len:119 (-),score=34.49 TRINITY_DN10455_c0_g1_i1:92-448(-)